MTRHRLGSAIISKTHFPRLKPAFTLAEALIASIRGVKQIFYFRDDSASQRQERVRENKMFVFAFTLAEVLYSKKLYSCAFTLAEVLIVLGIIGLIADMTIPTLHQNIEEKVTVTKLQKAYSTFSNAYRMVVSEKGPASEWNLIEQDPASSNLVFDNFEPYLNLIKKCKAGEEGCFPNTNYKFLNGTASGINMYNDPARARGQLADGSVFALLSGDGISATLYVDTNGTKPPNQWGRDFFELRIIAGEIIPTGTQKFNDQFETTCKDSKTQRGYYCAAWVIYNENMDYLHCSDLSWDGKKKCN